MTPNGIRKPLVVDKMPRDLRIVVEDDEDLVAEDDLAVVRHGKSPAPAFPVAPLSQGRGLIKPIAMKVVRPIPKRASEQFYNEAFEGGLTMYETNQAAVLAHDWHRKWTQQDEANHTMPEQDFYEQNTSMPGHYGLMLDRQGAKNPSLGGLSDDNTVMSVEEKGKRARQSVAAASEITSSRLSPEMGPRQQQQPLLGIPGIQLNSEPPMNASSWSEASEPSLFGSHIGPQVKRRYTGAVVIDDDEVEDDHEQPLFMPPPLAVRPLAVRPTPVRINRPASALGPAHEIPSGGIPHDIIAHRKESVSPLSCSPTSLSNSNSSFGSLFQTVLQPEQCDVHVVEDDDEEPTVPETIAEVKIQASNVPSQLEVARDGVLHALAVTKGDIDSDMFKSSIDPLEKYYSKQELDGRPQVVGSDSIDGMWLTLSKPTFFGCLGENDSGDPMYTLGRMSFDMFSPTNLVCSLQGNFNPVEVVNEEDRKAMLEAVPKSLRDEVESGTTVLRTYHVVTAFTIEPCLAAYPKAPNKNVSRPIKGIMTTYGYSLPDPNTPNRHSIWFTGGRIEPNNDPSDIFAWKKLFTMHPPKHTFGEKAKLLAVKLLMGATVPEEMSDDGSMEYAFTRPLGGHGMAYVDVIYLDESMRIVRGHRGTTFVFSRVGER